MPGRHFAAVLILAVAGGGHEATKARLEPGAPVGAGGVPHIGNGAAGNVGRPWEPPAHGLPDVFARAVDADEWRKRGRRLAAAVGLRSGQ